MTDLPPKIIRDAELEPTPLQQEAYTLAEKEGVIRLNSLGDTISVQHVLSLVMRLKQICTRPADRRKAAKPERLVADMTEVAESDCKAIVFAVGAAVGDDCPAPAHVGPLQFHGKTKAMSLLERNLQD